MTYRAELSGRALKLSEALPGVLACFRSEDYHEGQRAFAEKRPPVFSGR